MNFSRRIKSENCDNDELPFAARRALENYPQIAASPDFNRCVLERILTSRAPSRLELFCDRLDEIFARPILKLLGAAALGAVVALTGTGAVIICGKGSTPSEAAQAHISLAARREADFNFHAFDSRRLALMGALETPDARRREYSHPRFFGLDAPAQPQSALEKTGPDKRSSQCPVAFRASV